MQVKTSDDRKGRVGVRVLTLGHLEYTVSIEHHDLVHELPELREEIHTLKMHDAHFRRLFDEYHELTREIENMENEVLAVATVVEEAAKFRRVHLKDELYAMLTKTHACTQAS